MTDNLSILTFPAAAAAAAATASTEVADTVQFIDNSGLELY
jgi:hypothetical protein